LLVVGSECLIRNYCEAFIVNVPCQHQAGRTAVLVHPKVKRLAPCNNVYLPRLHPSATLIAPVAPLIPINVDSATVIGCQPKLNRVMHRDRDEACHVNHEQVARAIQVWLTVIRTVDIVLNLRTTQLILSS
jgi:hypothetical protein